MGIKVATLLPTARAWIITVSVIAGLSVEPPARAQLLVNQD